MYYKLILIMFLLGCSGVEAFKTAEGVSNGTVYFEAVRNPFVGGVKLGGFTVVITNPQQSITYYTHVMDINTTITGGSPPYTCRYRINAGGWNNMTDCETNQTTFPLGWVTLEVEATDQNTATSSDIVTFFVSGMGLGGSAPDMLILVFVLLTSIILVVATDKGEQNNGKEDKRDSFDESC